MHSWAPFTLKFGRYATSNSWYCRLQARTSRRSSRLHRKCRQWAAGAKLVARCHLESALLARTAIVSTFRSVTCEPRDLHLRLRSDLATTDLIGKCTSANDQAAIPISNITWNRLRVWSQIIPPRAKLQTQSKVVKQMVKHFLDSRHGCTWVALALRNPGATSRREGCKLLTYFTSSPTAVIALK